MEKKQKQWIYAAALVWIAVLLIILVRTGDDSTSPAPARAAVVSATPVVVAPATEDIFVETLEALGTARANESVTITPTVSDRITALNFDDGDSVSAGQVLVELNSEEEKSLLQEARAALDEQQLQFARIKNLASRRAASQSQLEEEEGLLKAAAARVANLEAKLGDYTIEAPFSGVLGIRQVSPGAVVETDTIITTLDDLSVVKLDFQVPETYLAALRSGMPVTARTKAYPDRTFQGKVTVVDTRVDPVTRSITVRADIPNPDLLLKPGMLLTVDVVKSESSTLMIPEEAILMEKEKKFVWVVGAENTVSKREIVTDRRRPGAVEVLSGLEAGELVITSGTNRVRPGSVVEIVETESAGDA